MNRKSFIITFGIVLLLLSTFLFLPSDYVTPNILIGLPHLDKIFHFMSFFFLSLLILFEGIYSLKQIMGLLFLFAVFSEIVIQGISPYRQIEYLDILFNLLGVVTAFGIFFLLPKNILK
jgi:VanZ family protein